MIKQLFNKHKDVILYAFFGVCTTLVNTVVYWICADLLYMATVFGAMVAWFFAVLFAYFTNRKWVFSSEATTKKDVLKELVSFFVCRIATGVVDWVCMFVFVDLLHFHDMIIKVAANLLVIVLNYIASKVWIFKRKRVTADK